MGNSSDGPLSGVQSEWLWGLGAFLAIPCDADGYNAGTVMWLPCRRLSSSLCVFYDGRVMIVGALGACEDGAEAEQRGWATYLPFVPGRVQGPECGRGRERDKQACAEVPKSPGTRFYVTVELRPLEEGSTMQLLHVHCLR